MFAFPTQFRGLSEGLHQTEQVFHESWHGAGTGKGDVDVSRGKRPLREGNHEKRDRAYEETACEAGGGGGSAHGVACERGLYPVDTGEPQQFFFFYQGHNLQTFKFILFQCTPVQVLPNETCRVTAARISRQSLYHSQIPSCLFVVS